MVTLQVPSPACEQLVLEQYMHNPLMNEILHHLFLESYCGANQSYVEADHF